MKLHAEIPDPWASELVELCRSAPGDGCIVECGVYKGGTAQAFYEIRGGRSVHLFDTWKGIPEFSKDDAIELGKFSDPDLEAIRREMPQAVIHEGMFPATFSADLPLISFAHIDFDQYMSTAHAIRLLWPKIVVGGIMVFDDYAFVNIKRAIEENLPGGTASVTVTQSGIAYAQRR